MTVYVYINKLCSCNVDKEDLILCVKCNKALHSSCENKLNNNKDYTQCPSCNNIGCLGIKSEYAFLKIIK